VIRLVEPRFPESVVDGIRMVLASGQLVQGTNVAELERQIALRLDIDHVVAVSSGTVALELALREHEIGPGARVLVPAYSFVATANAVVSIGATPVFADVNEETLTLDPRAASCVIRDAAVDALLPVHEFGHPADIASLRSIPEFADLPIIEDAACALGTDDGEIGRQGNVSCFSLHPRKVLTAGEGGLVASSNRDIADRIRLVRNHGLVVSDGQLDCVYPGTNARMTEMQAVLALGHLEGLDKSIARRREIASVYLTALADLDSIQPPSASSGNLNWQTFIIRFRSTTARDRAAHQLRRAEIESSVGAQCIPAMAWYRENRISLESVAEEFPNAWRAWTTGLAIPLHEHMSDFDVNHVLETLTRIEVEG
jgi:perosamine synthetase